MAKEKSILYFDEVGEKNTDETLKATKKRAEELRIKDIWRPPWAGQVLKPSRPSRTTM